MMQVISNIIDPLQTPEKRPELEAYTQINNQSDVISFETQRESFTKKLEDQHERLQSGEDFDTEEFNKKMAKFK